MNANESQVVLENYKLELDAARDVIADLSAHMQADAAEYKEQIEKALIRVSDLSKNLPQSLRASVEDSIRMSLSSVAERLTAAVTRDAEASAGNARKAILELRAHAAATVQAVVAARWKMLTVLWGSPLLLFLLGGALIAQDYRHGQDELGRIEVQQAAALDQYHSLHSMSGGMFYNATDPRQPVLFVPADLPMQHCTLPNGRTGLCVTPRATHTTR